jgi:hypothetical protein
MKRKTEARKVLEARNASYGNRNMPSGYVDETTLLLMSQDAGERATRKRVRRKRRGK